MNNLTNRILKKYDLKSQRKTKLSLVSDADEMATKLNEDILGLASDSYPVYADDTVFQQLIDAYQEIKAEIQSLLDQYDVEEAYDAAVELDSIGDSLIQEGIGVKMELQNQANTLGIDPTTIDEYNVLSRAIEDAEESMKYSGSAWQQAYNDIQNIRNL